MAYRKDHSECICWEFLHLDLLSALLSALWLYLFTPWTVGVCFLSESRPLITVSPFLPPVCVRALDVTVSQSSIQVARGQAAILPCSFTTSAALNNLNIIWMVIPLSNANQPEQVWITVHPLASRVPIAGKIEECSSDMQEGLRAYSKRVFTRILLNLFCVFCK